MKQTLNPRREVLFELFDVARALRTYVDQRAREHGMTRAQWGVLARLERDEGMMQAEMADALEIQPISLVRLVDRLCEQGLIERRAHPTDRRIRTLCLTPAARPVIERILVINQAIREEAFADMPAQARDTIVNILNGIKDNLVLQEEAADSPAVAAVAGGI